MSGYLNRLLRQSGLDAPGSAPAPLLPAQPADPFAPEADGLVETDAGDHPAREASAASTGGALPIQHGMPPRAGDPAAPSLPPETPALPGAPTRLYPAQPAGLEQALAWVSGGPGAAEDLFAGPPEPHAATPASGSPIAQPAPEPRRSPTPAAVAPPGNPTPAARPAPTVSPRPGEPAQAPASRLSSAPPAEPKAPELRLSIGRIDVTVEPSSAAPPHDPPQISWRAPSRLGRYYWRRR